MFIIKEKIKYVEKCKILDIKKGCLPLNFRKVRLHVFYRDQCPFHTYGEIHESYRHITLYIY